MKYLALVTGCFNVAKLGDVEIYRLTQVSFIGLTRDSRLIHVADVSKLLSSGHFYFSVPGDTEFFSLTCSAQQHITDPVSDFTWYVWWEWGCEGGVTDFSIMFQEPLPSALLDRLWSVC